MNPLTRIPAGTGFSYPVPKFSGKYESWEEVPAHVLDSLALQANNGSGSTIEEEVLDLADQLFQSGMEPEEIVQLFQGFEGHGDLIWQCFLDSGQDLETFKTEIQKRLVQAVG